MQRNLVCFGWRNEEEKKASSIFLEEEALCGRNSEDRNIEIGSRRKKGRCSFDIKSGIFLLYVPVPAAY